MGAAAGLKTSPRICCSTRRPGDGRRVLTPGAVEHPDDDGAAVAGEHVDGATRITLLTDDAVGHREPAVVDGLHGATALAGHHAEVTHRLTLLRHHRRVDGQCPTVRKDVVDLSVGCQGDGFPVGDHVVGGDGGAVGRVVAEGRLMADDVAILVADQSRCCDNVPRCRRSESARRRIPACTGWCPAGSPCRGGRPHRERRPPASRRPEAYHQEWRSSRLPARPRANTFGATSSPIA